MNGKCGVGRKEEDGVGQCEGSLGAFSTEAQLSVCLWFSPQWQNIVMPVHTFTSPVILLFHLHSTLSTTSLFSCSGYASFWLNDFVVVIYGLSAGEIMDKTSNSPRSVLLWRYPLRWRSHQFYNRIQTRYFLACKSRQYGSTKLDDN